MNGTYQIGYWPSAPGFLSIASSLTALISQLHQYLANGQVSSPSKGEIASFGSCHFGVQNSGVFSDATFHTGSQDIVRSITQSISQFSSNALVGAKGCMKCDGNVGSQKIEWGLY